MTTGRRSTGPASPSRSQGRSEIDFVSIQNAVLADGFAENDRLAAKEWINFRYEWLWDVDEWTFRNGTATVSLSPNSNTVGNLPANLGIPLALFRSDGTPLQPVADLRVFQGLYGSAATGTPEAFCPVGTSILVGPRSSVTDAACTLVHEIGWVPLVNNPDVPLIPAGYHLALVHGGKAEGLKLKNIPLWESFDADFQAAITAMRRNFLAPVRGDLVQAGAYRPC